MGGRSKGQGQADRKRGRGTTKVVDSGHEIRELEDVFGTDNVTDLGSVTVVEVNSQNAGSILNNCAGSRGKMEIVKKLAAAMTADSDNDDEKCEARACNNCKNRFREEMDETVKNDELGKKTGAKKKMKTAVESKDDNDCCKSPRSNEKQGFLCDACVRRGKIVLAENAEELRYHVEHYHVEYLIKESTRNRLMSCNLCALKGTKYYARSEEEVKKHARSLHPGALEVSIAAGHGFFTILDSAVTAKKCKKNLLF